MSVRVKVHISSSGTEIALSAPPLFPWITIFDHTEKVVKTKRLFVSAHLRRSKGLCELTYLFACFRYVLVETKQGIPIKGDYNNCSDEMMW
jgi:hypothetical protein